MPITVAGILAGTSFDTDAIGLDYGSPFERTAFGDAWKKVDSDLAQWLKDPEALVDFDAIPPTRKAIRTARAIVPALESRKWPAPAIVVPDLNGGISLEFHSGTLYKNVEIRADGTSRLLVFRNGRLHADRLLRLGKTQ